MPLITLLYLFGVPLALMLLAKRWPIIEKISPMVILYIIGLVVGNAGWLGVGTTNICTQVSNVVVLLTIPLMLLGCNYKSLSAKMALKAFFSGLVSVLTVTVAGFFLFHGQAAATGLERADFARISAVMAGIYIGGIPNLAPVSKAVELPQHLFLLVSSYDLIVTGLYLIVIVFFGNVIVRTLFSKKSQASSTENDTPETEHHTKKTWPKTLLNRAMGIGIALLIALIAYCISMLLPTQNSVAIIIIAITTLSIAISFLKPVKKLEGTFDMGLYFVYVFCLAVATMVNVHDLELSKHLFILYYIGFAVFGSLALQLLAAKIFKIDGDLSRFNEEMGWSCKDYEALKNKDIILPGIAIGLLGYAVGNYLGIGIFLMLR